jgi:hypothetical protein
MYGTVFYLARLGPRSTWNRSVTGRSKIAEEGEKERTSNIIKRKTYKVREREKESLAEIREGKEKNVSPYVFSFFFQGKKK